MTEAVIFFFSAFEPLHEEIDWTLVYPELAGIPEDETESLGSHGSGRARDAGGAIGSGGYSGGGFGGGGYGGGAGSAALAKFDEMLEKAEITPELFQKLGEGMKKFGTATTNISAMNDIAAASNKYSATIKGSNRCTRQTCLNHIRQQPGLLTKQVLLIRPLPIRLAVMQEGGRSYQQQLEMLNKNLSALNTAYELQKKGADNHLKESESLYSGLQNLMKDLTESSGDTKKYREQVAKLNDNLSALNNVYGNMLAAMNVK